MARSNTIALLNSLIGSQAPKQGGHASQEGKAQGNSKGTNTRPDGTYTIGNSTNRLARIYLIPTGSEGGIITGWRAEAIDNPRILAMFRDLSECLATDIADEPNLPLHQRPVDLECGVTARITEKMQWHGEKFSIIVRLSEGELPKAATTKGAAVQGKGKVRRGDMVLVEDGGLCGFLSDMAQAAMERGQVGMGNSDTE